MLRAILSSVCALGLFATVVFAGERRGQIQSVDADKGVVTVGNPLSSSVKDAKPTDYKVTKETKLLDADGKELKDGIKSEQLKKGAMVQVTFDDEKKDQAKEIKLIGKKK